MKPYLFLHAELEQAVSRGNTVVLCRGVDSVSVYGLAPDLAMSETNRPMIQYEELTLSNELYSNNQHKVSRATFLYFFLEANEKIPPSPNHPIRH